MKNAILLKVLLITAAFWFISPGLLAAQASEKRRMIIMADMDNEPDEMQQNIHMILYSNRIDLEGLIACTGIYLKSRVAPEEYTKIINAYAQVYDNLQKHASGWPTSDYLHSINKPGRPEYGIGGTGDGKDSEGSRLIEAALRKDDPRPIYFIVNAGSNTLAQALIDLEKKLTAAEMEAITKKVFVFENGAQDNSGAWIAGNFPAVTWYRSSSQTYAYGGNKWPDPDGPHTWGEYAYSSSGQHDWAEEHIMNNHGPLGELYPYRTAGEGVAFLEGGGTIPFMGLTVAGLVDPWRLWWGGWSGRLSRGKSKIYSGNSGVKPDEEKYNFDWKMHGTRTESESWTDPTGKTWGGENTAVYRWRQAMWNEEQALMDWCVKEYHEANHRPVTVFNGDSTDKIIEMQALPGQQLALNSAGTYDPDGDNVSVRWWVYREAGTYDNDIAIPNATADATTLTIPHDALDKEIHLIMEIEDDNSIVHLYNYRRVVINVVREITDVNSLKKNPVKPALTYRQTMGSPNFENTGSEDIQVRILSVDGKELSSVTLKPSASKLIALPRGIYIAHVFEKEKKKTNKFSVIHEK